MNSVGTGVFRHLIHARFGDCDPAGIVYFPRFFDWFHQAMEAWFGACLDLAYHDLLKTRGLPAVHTEADFKAPVRFGDRVDIELRVGRIGGSSIVLNYRVVGHDSGQLHATGATTCVLMGTLPGSEEHLKAVPFPDDLRARLEHFQSG